MSSIAELLNSVSNALNGGRTELGPSPQPAWQQAITKPVIGFADKIVRGIAQEADPKSLVDAFTRINPVTAPVRMAQDFNEGGVKQVVDTTRAYAGQVAQIPTDIAAAVPGLWALAGLGTKKAFDYDLPGAQGAADATLAIKKFGEEQIGEPIAGRDLSESLLQGNGVDVAGSWMRLIGGAAINAPIALPRVATSIEAINKVSNTAINAAEILTPVLIAKKPSPGLIGANVGIAGTLATGLEGVLGSSNDPEQIKAKLDAFSKSAQDTATKELEEVKTVQAGLTGDTTWDTAAIAGLVGVSLFAGYKSDAIYRATTGLLKGETTQVPRGVVFREQIGNRGAPIEWAGRKQLDDPHTVLERVGAVMKGKPFDKGARDAGDRFANSIDERHGAATNAKIEYTYETGEFPNSAIKIMPPNDFFTGVRNADDSVKAEASRYMNARHEIDTRQRIATEDKNINVSIKNPGTAQADTLFQSVVRMKGWDDSKVAHHMSDVSTADLYKIISGPISPEAKAIADQYRNMVSKVPQYLYEQKHITKQEMFDLMRQNPHYVATKLVDGQKHLSRENAKAGQGLLDPGSPLEEFPKYLDEVIRTVEGNKIRRSFLETTIKNADNGNPFAKSLLERRNAKLYESKTAGDRSVSYRDHNGVARDIEIADPIVRRALQNIDRPSQLMMHQGSMKWASGSARTFEAGAVGPIAASTGTIFGPIAALYASAVGPIMRNKRHGAAGWMDKAVQELTKKMFPKDSYFHGMGVRGDPTMLAEYPFRVAQGLWAMMAQRMGRALKDSVITGGLMSKHLSPATAQMWGDKLSEIYRRSYLAKLQQDGQLGPVSMTSIDPTKRFKDAQAMIANPTSIGGKAVAPFKSGFHLLEDILHVLSTAPAATLYSINKNNDAWRTNALIRNFSGDPAKSGAFSAPAFKALGKGVAATPWGNIFIQANLQMAKAFKDDPIATSVGAFNLIGIPTILATIHNATEDDYVDPVTGQVQSYSDYQFNKRAPDRQAGYIYFAHPGRPPEQGYEIPVEPALAPFKFGMELIAGSHLGLMDGTLFKPGNENFRQALAESVGKRQMSFGEGSVPSAILHRTFIPPVPPALGVPAAMMGVKLRSYGDVSPIPEGRNAGFNESKAKNPNRSVLGFSEPAQMEEIMAAIGADGARTIYNTLMDSAQFTNEGKSKEIPKYVAQKFSQRLGDTTKYASGSLFESFQSITPSLEAASQNVKSKMAGIKELTQAYRDVTEKGALVGNMIGNSKRGMAQGPGAGPALAKDPGTMLIAQTMAQVGPQLISTYQGENQDLYTARAQVANSTQYSPQQKRALMNVYGEQIITNNRRMLQHIQMIERNLSEQLGVRVTLDKVDLNKGLDQFKPLAR